MSSPPRLLTSFESPRCPVCQNRMMLERISPGPTGFEHQLFECLECEQFETTVVASDPFNSKAEGWLSGELGRTAVTHGIKDEKLIPKSAK
jgi:hypothetical protein